MTLPCASRIRYTPGAGASARSLREKSGGVAGLIPASVRREPVAGTELPTMFLSGKRQLVDRVIANTESADHGLIAVRQRADKKHGIWPESELDVGSRWISR